MSDTTKLTGKMWRRLARVARRRNLPVAGLITISAEDGATDDNAAIVIRTVFGLDECGAEYAEAIGQHLDDALRPFGFSRKASTETGDHFEWRYYQAAAFLGDGAGDA